MIAVVGNYGPHLKPPSYHELRVPLLKNEVDKVDEWVEGHRLEWTKHGCSIMTDRKQRTLIKFLVNNAKGTIFMESVDAFSYMKTGDKIFELLDNFAEKVGEKNVVQVITDNGSNFKKKLAKCSWRRGDTYFGHLVLLTVWILCLKTLNNELTRCGVTRFATTYLTFKSLHTHKTALGMMFVDEKWTTTKWCKEAKGKRANDIVFTPSFWNNIIFTIKVMSPLVKVLRLVDNEKKPAMGYIYEAMEMAKLAINKALSQQQDEYKIISDIIDNRWNSQLHHPLHAVGYYLNPEFYCYNEKIEEDREVSTCLHESIKRLVPDKDIQDLIMSEMVQWVNQEGFFRLEVANRAHGKIPPAGWWKLYGKGTPNLQQFTIKVLSLTCSASECERNWSTFEHIHSKKRNILEHLKLQELVYVKYNNMFRNHRDKAVAFDPISLDDIDDSNEWLTGIMEDDRVHSDEDLTWTMVGDASGAGEPPRRTKSSHPSSSRPSSSSRPTSYVSLIDEDSEEEEDAPLEVDMTA